MNLFRSGEFDLHSGNQARWKIDCDALTDDDIETLALMFSEILPPFGDIVGIPRGGVRIAEALIPFSTQGPTLIVDDVLTTGNSIGTMRFRVGGPTIGAVIFARGPCPRDVYPLFQMTPPRPEYARILPSDMMCDYWTGTRCCNRTAVGVVGVDFTPYCDWHIDAMRYREEQST